MRSKTTHFPSWFHKLYLSTSLFRYRHVSEAQRAYSTSSSVSHSSSEFKIPATMQRAAYGQSPPLHHPVPQHVSTVPQLRSPPPPVPQPQQQAYGGSPYQQQGAAPSAGPAGNAFGQYGNFINDPTAQLASQFGQTAFRHGQEYLEQNASGGPLSRGRALVDARG